MTFCSCWHAYNSIRVGLPPPDITLRVWLHSAANPSKQAIDTQQLRAFVYALLRVTCNHLEAIVSECGNFPTIALPTTY